MQYSLWTIQTCNFAGRLIYLHFRENVTLLHFVHVFLQDLLLKFILSVWSSFSVNQVSESIKNIFLGKTAKNEVITPQL